MPVTLYDKLWDEHLVETDDTNESLIYIDRHYLHEVTSPQAFEGLRHKNLKPWRLDAILSLYMSLWVCSLNSSSITVIIVYIYISYIHK